MAPHAQVPEFSAYCFKREAVFPADKVCGVVLLWALPNSTDNLGRRIGSECALSHPVSYCESQRLSFPVLKSELRCKNYKSEDSLSLEATPENLRFKCIWTNMFSINNI